MTVIFMYMQITFSILFSLVIAFISDALGTVPDKASVLSRDASFRSEFQEIVSLTTSGGICCIVYHFSALICDPLIRYILQVIASGNDPMVEGFVDIVRFSWAAHLMLVQDGTVATETVSSASSNDLGYICSCLEVIFANNVFQFLLDKALKTAAYQVLLLN